MDISIKNRDVYIYIYLYLYLYIYIFRYICIITCINIQFRKHIDTFMFCKHIRIWMGTGIHT